jgi:hypothetical protein
VYRGAGGGWNSAQSTFIVPRDGVYLFSFSAAAAAGNRVEVNVVIDGDASHKRMYMCTLWFSPPVQWGVLSLLFILLILHKF